MHISMLIELIERRQRNQTSKKQGWSKEQKSLRRKSRWRPEHERLALDRNDISCSVTWREAASIHTQRSWEISWRYVSKFMFDYFYNIIKTEARLSAQIVGWGAYWSYYLQTET